MRRRFRRVLAFVLIAILLGVVAIYLFRGVPVETAAAMRQADSFELLSLDPDREKAGRDFHGFKVLGRARLSDPIARERLYDALQSAARWNIPLPAMCFDPRHAIRVTAHGRTLDLLICFECKQVQIWEGDNLVGGFIVSDSPESAFDQIYRTAGLPIAN